MFPYINAWVHHHNNLLAYADILFNIILFHINANGLLYCKITQYDTIKSLIFCPIRQLGNSQRSKSTLQRSKQTKCLQKC